MTLAQFIHEVFNEVKDPYKQTLRIGQTLMNCLHGRNPKAYAFIMHETNYDCFYNNDMVASTISCLMEHPEFWEQ